MQVKDKHRVDPEIMFKHLGVSPQAGIEHIENKNTADIDPEHVMVLLLLRKWTEEQLVFSA